MKKIERADVIVVKCAERERLYGAFLAVAKEWQSMQDRMRKALAGKGAFDPDMSELEGMKDKLERSRKLYTRHIEQHGCWHARKPAVKTKTKSGRGGK